jgi:hypothetical protein
MLPSHRSYKIQTILSIDTPYLCMYAITKEKFTSVVLNLCRKGETIQVVVMTNICTKIVLKNQVLSAPVGKEERRPLLHVQAVGFPVQRLVGHAKNNVPVNCATTKMEKNVGQTKNLELADAARIVRHWRRNVVCPHHAAVKVWTFL